MRKKIQRLSGSSVREPSTSNLFNTKKGSSVREPNMTLYVIIFIRFILKNSQYFNEIKKKKKEPTKFKKEIFNSKVHKKKKKHSQYL